MSWLFILIIFLYIFFLFLIYFNIHYFPSIHKEIINNNNNDLNINKNLLELTNINELKNITNFQTYYYDNKNKAIQPINFILITNKNPLKFFLEKNWSENKVFGKDKITFKDYFRSFKTKTLPMSVLFLNNKPQDFSLQFKSDSLLKRKHLRLWKFAKIKTNNTNKNNTNKNNTNKNNTNKIIYLGSMSEDESLSLVFYNYFITPLHEINQLVDDSRDFLLTNIIKNINKNESIICQYQNLGLKKQINSITDIDINYQTDGKIVVCEY